MGIIVMIPIKWKTKQEHQEFILMYQMKSKSLTEDKQSVRGCLPSFL